MCRCSDWTECGRGCRRGLGRRREPVGARERDVGTTSDCNARTSVGQGMVAGIWVHYLEEGIITVISSIYEASRTLSDCVVAFVRTRSEACIRISER